MSEELFRDPVIDIVFVSELNGISDFLTKFFLWSSAFKTGKIFNSATSVA